MNIELSDPQIEFLTTDYPFVAFVAGFRAGKTFASVLKCLLHMKKYPYINTLYLEPTYGLMRDVVYPQFEEFLESANISYKLNKSTNVIDIEGHGNVLCRTMDRPERIIGFEIGQAFLDEFDTLPKRKAEEIWRRVNSRLSQKYHDGSVQGINISTTPEGYRTTYKLFEKEINEHDDRLLIRAPTSSNENLDERYIENLKNQYPEKQLQAYLEGKFVNLESGTVYYTFSREKNGCDAVVEKGEALHIGMDFNVENMSAVVFVIRDKIAYIVDEFVGLKDTPNMIISIKRKYTENRIYVYPDASGNNRKSVDASNTDLSLLSDAGFKVITNKTNPFVKDRVLCVNNAFEHCFVYINVDKAPVTTECLEQQIYNEKGTPDKTSGNDHTNDALGYFIVKKYPIKRASFTSSPLVF